MFYIKRLTKDIRYKMIYLKKQLYKIVLLSVLIIPTISYAELLSVQVKKTYLRDKPSFLSKQKTKLSYAQQVELKNEKNSWSFIKTVQGGTQGWVHNSALSTKTIVLQSSKRVSNTSVSQSEILMAGKGFNKNVEDEYKKQKVNLNYKMIDAIEKNNQIDTRTLINFAKKGKLNL